VANARHDGGDIMSATARTADEIRGLEYDWLACDADGHVALFSTAGGGYAPEAFLRDTDAHDAAIEALLAGPAVTTAQSAPDLPPDLTNTWRLVAERGLFAFDADVHGGPYRRVAEPTEPIRVAELHGVARDVVASLVLCSVRFAMASVVPAELITPVDASAGQRAYELEKS
jgi:hypothetical protein